MRTFKPNSDMAAHFFSLPYQDAKKTFDQQKALFLPMEEELKKYAFKDKYFESQYNDWLSKKSGLQQDASLVTADQQKNKNTRFERFYNDFWLSEKDKQQREADLYKSHNLLVNRTSIAKQLYACAENPAQKPSSEAQKAIYLAWDKEPEEAPFGPQAIQGKYFQHELMGLDQSTTDLQALLTARAHKPLSTIEYLITLPRTKGLLGSALGLSTIWAGTIQAGLLVVSPLVACGVPLAIFTSLFLYNAIATSIIDRHYAKTNYANELNKKIMNPLTDISDQLRKLIWQTYNNSKTIIQQTDQINSATGEIKKDMRTGVAALNELADATHQSSKTIIQHTDEIKQDLRTGATALNELTSTAHQTSKKIIQHTDEIKQDLRTGATALNELTNTTHQTSKAIIQHTDEIKQDLRTGATVLNELTNATHQTSKKITQHTDEIKQDLRTGATVLLQETGEIKQDMQTGVAALNEIANASEDIKKSQKRFQTTVEEVQEEVQEGFGSIREDLSVGVSVINEMAARMEAMQRQQQLITTLFLAQAQSGALNISPEILLQLTGSTTPQLALTSAPAMGVVQDTPATNTTLLQPRARTISTNSDTNSDTSDGSMPGLSRSTSPSSDSSSDPGSPVVVKKSTFAPAQNDDGDDSVLILSPEEIALIKKYRNDKKNNYA